MVVKMDINFKQQSVGETTYLVMDMEEHFVIDSFAINMMARNRMINIVPTQIVQINEKKLVQFNITGLVKLNGWLSQCRPKKEVLSIFNSILNAFEEADAYMLDMEHLFLDWEYIYLDGQGNCMLLYFPFDYVCNKDKIVFLQEVVSSVRPDYQEKDPYLFDILNAFGRGGIRKLSDFREIMKKSISIQGKEYQEQRKEEVPIAQNVGKNFSVPQEQEVKTVPKEAEKKTGKKSSMSPRIPVINIPGREPGAKTGVQETAQEIEKKESKKKGFFKKKGKKQTSFLIPGKHKEEKIENSEERSNNVPNGFRSAGDTRENRPNDLYESYENTVMMPEPVSMRNEDEGTVMLGQTDFFMQAKASLIRKKDRTSYRIDRDKVILGSGTAADICIYNNSAISRSHAMILYVNGEYYVEDNQSKNGSFINGRRLQPGVREPLYDGMVIRLANEDFEFSKD